MTIPELTDDNQASESYYKLLDYYHYTDKSFPMLPGKNILYNVVLADYFKNYRDFPEIVTLIDDEISKRSTNFSGKRVLIPVLDFENVGNHISDEMMVFFLSRYLQEFKAGNFLIVGLEKKILVDTINKFENADNTEPLPWRADQCILIYPYELDDDGNRIFYNELFGGSTLAEYHILTHKLFTTHLTFEKFQHLHEVSYFSRETLNTFKQSSIFVNITGVIQNFELILKFRGKSFFENSMEYILNTDITLEENGFPGYKIKNSHFKLGSKIHIKDFVYAKRIFQNSFFTNRFAFLVTKYFLETHSNVTSLTIIGYGMYSQLLINRIEKMLLQRIKRLEINHDMVSDAENPFFIKNVTFHKKILVVVPINTTFSTTVKMENLISKRIERSHEHILLSPSVNLILVSHGDFNDLEHVTKLNKLLDGNVSLSENEPSKNCPYLFLNWKEIDPIMKIVRVKINSRDDENRDQRYFLTVPSEIYLPEFCNLCFPGYEEGSDDKDILKEALLLETDKASVTPDLLLNLPVNYKNKECTNDDRVVINPEALVSGHVVYKGNHFHHFINSEPFFNRYPTEILQWAKRRKIELFEERKDLLNAGVLLISSGDRYNTYFTDFINREVFDDSAIIIHYDVAGQGIDNFIKFFSPHIWQAEYIFYIDDVMHGGRTFGLMNDVVRHCQKTKAPKSHKKGSPGQKSIDGLFTLISKNDDFTRSNIIGQFGDTFREPYNAFYFLNIDALDTKKCPICKAHRHYSKLANDAVLDSVKTYFFENAQRLKQRDVNELLVINNRDDRWNWKNFDPLVALVGKSEIPWNTNNPNSKAKAIYEVYKRRPLPSKSYLMLLIHHELNTMISNDPDIRACLLLSKKSKDDHENTRENATKLFDLLLTGIKKRAYFLLWYQNAPQIAQNAYDLIINELIIRILTESPFNNVSAIKEKLFTYVLSELNTLLISYKTESSSFSSFYRIIFLMKRSAIIGSNYLLHPLTFTRIKRIYEGYKEKLPQLENKRQRDHHGIDRAINENKTLDNLVEKAYREKFLVQQKANVEYIEASRREFGYFFVATIKEINTGGDAKIIKLEKLIDNFYSKGVNTEDLEFYYFLRLIKYENISIMKTSVHLIYREFIRSLPDYIPRNHGDLDINILSAAFDKSLNNAFNDYRFIYLKRYLHIDEFYQWKKAEPIEYVKFLQVLYVYILLKKDEEQQANQHKADLQTKSILRSFFRIAGDTQVNVANDGVYSYNYNNDGGAFLVLKFHDEQDQLIDHSGIVVAESTNAKSDDVSMMNAPVNENSLSYLMINGLSNRDFAIDQFTNMTSGDSIYKKPWILWEIFKDDPQKKHWQSYRGNVYPINHRITNFCQLLFKEDNVVLIRQNFTESAFLPTDINHISLLRLSKIQVKNNRVTNDGRGVIGLYRKKNVIKNTISLEEIHRLRVPLILLPSITSYIKKHYDAAMFKELVKTEEQIYDSIRARHEHHEVLKELTAIAKKNNKSRDEKKFIDILERMLLSGERLADMVENFKHWTKKDFSIGYSPQTIMGRINIKTMTLGDLQKNIFKIFNLVVANTIEKISASVQKPANQFEYRNGLDKDFEVEIAYGLFELVVIEALVNAKKHNKTSQYNLDLIFDLKDDLMLIIFKNNIQYLIPEATIRRLNLYKRNYTHGLGLIDWISVEMFGELPEKDVTFATKPTGEIQHQFSLSIPLTRL